MKRIVVVGAGIVGLAVAREVLQRHPGMTEILVLEKESQVAQHQTSHNSGVIHAGALYPPGSAKTAMCLRGASLLTQYMNERGIPHRFGGKLFIATRADEAERLRALYERGLKAGVPGIDFVLGDRIADYEPNAVGIAAVRSPRSGVVDFARVALAIADELLELGAEIKLDHEVLAISSTRNGARLETTHGEYTADLVITCAGLHSDRLASAAGENRAPRIYPFRGVSFELPAARADLVRSLIYPVPNPAVPFLGVHAVRHVDGTLTIGPTAFPALAREGYRGSDVELRQLAEFAHPTFLKFAWRFRRSALSETAALLSRRVVLRRAQRFLPDLKLEDLAEVRTGVRAQALAKDGGLIDDFRIERTGHVVSVRNARSPAATAALAIAERVVDAVPQLV